MLLQLLLTMFHRNVLIFGPLRTRYPKTILTTLTLESFKM